MSALSERGAPLASRMSRLRVMIATLAALGCFKDEGPEQTGSTSSLHGLGIRVAVDSVGSAGLVNRSDAAWTEGCGEVACTLALRLYCVEQQP